MMTAHLAIAIPDHLPHVKLQVLQPHGEAVHICVVCWARMRVRLFNAALTRQQDAHDLRKAEGAGHAVIEVDRNPTCCSSSSSRVRDAVHCSCVPGTAQQHHSVFPFPKMACTPLQHQAVKAADLD